MMNANPELPNIPEKSPSNVHRNSGLLCPDLVFFQCGQSSMLTNGKEYRVTDYGIFLSHILRLLSLN